MSEQKYKLVPVERSWPRVYGIGRMFDNDKALLISMERKPSDDELRALDNFIKGYIETPNRDLDELIEELSKPGISIDDIRRARKALSISQDPYAMRDKASKGRDTNKNKTHCVHGHERNEINTYVDSRGLKHCRVCHRIRELQHRQKRRA